MLSAVAHEEDTATISDENAQNLKEKNQHPSHPPKNQQTNKTPKQTP